MTYQYQTSGSQLHNYKISLADFNEGIPCLYLRHFDVLYSFLFIKNPRLPSSITILHCSQNDLGDLESRITESDYQRDEFDNVAREDVRDLP